MKDRFVKVMLVIITGLLLLNCFKDNGDGISIPFFSTSAKASVPPFVRQGVSINCNFDGDVVKLTITGVDRDSGWVKAKFNFAGIEGDSWMNLSRATKCN